MNWKWNDKARQVRIEEPQHPEVGVDLVWTLPLIGEIKAFEYSFEKARRVYVILESARNSFEGGRAKYENASEEVRHLIDESNKAALELLESMSRIDRWFESPVSPLFNGDGDRFMAFCKEWIDRAGHGPEVLGNSSREPSENSLKRLPKTAEIASGSSSAPKESHNAPEFGKTKGSRKKIARDAHSS